jgi:hypothetical protein
MKSTEIYDSLNLLRDRRRRLEAALLKLAPTEMQEYVRVSAAIRVMEELSGTLHHASQYAAHRKAIDAILDYLNREGVFSERNAIAKAITDGGFAPKDKRRFWNVLDGIRYHLVSKVPRLIERDGLIGLPEWDESHMPLRPTLGDSTVDAGEHPASTDLK